MCMVLRIDRRGGCLMEGVRAWYEAERWPQRLDDKEEVHGC